MSEIWNLETILWTIGLFATVLFILKLLVFMVTGGDMEIESDFDVITETETSFNYFSIQAILAFLMAFGWCGYVALKNFNFHTSIILLAAFITGTISMWFSAYIMINIKKLNKKIIIDINELVGKEGKSYTKFEPNGNGRIEISLNKRLSILDAINLSNEKIDAFTPIKVEKIEDKKIYIVKK